MAQVTFSGDPRNPGTDPAKLVMHGVTFPLGQPVEVADDIAAKLRTHSHFTADGEAPVEKPVETAKGDRMAKARAARAAKKVAEKIDA